MITMVFRENDDGYISLNTFNLFSGDSETDLFRSILHSNNLDISTPMRQFLHISEKLHK